MYMTTAAPVKLLTNDEFLALADDGVERMLLDGIVYELSGEDGEMTKRNPTHSFVQANVTRIVGVWTQSQAQPRGRVYCGEVGFLLKRNPDTTVGIDVAYVDAETAARTPPDAEVVESAPVLAVEVLSPSDRQERILMKVRAYLDAGTKLVWIVEPLFETVSVYRPDAPPMMLNASQEISAEPHLPDFRCKVAEFFGS